MNEAMYAEQAAMKQYAYNNAVAGGIDTYSERTVEENIDIKIAALRKEIERLEASKVSLAPLLNMRIRDVREAMSY